LIVARVIATGLEGGLPTEHLLQEHGTLQIGRSDGNELKINSPKASRFHAVIRATETGVQIQDLGSLNGTFLNGRLIGAVAEVKSGDKILVCGVEFLIELTQEIKPARNDETKPVELQAFTGSLLVSDIRGYTRLSEELPAQELASVLRVWTEKVTTVVGLLDGVIDKFNGDSVLAYWLRPSSSADSSRDSELAEKCFAAAKRIEAETISLESSVLWPFSPKYRWAVKSSIASGEVIFGNLGRGDARSFTVVGDTVNIVFRMNDLCSELGKDLLADESTAKLMEGSQRFRFLQNVTLEGRRESIKIYSLKNTEKLA
jgi:class 3 adenylate cyclase